MDCELIEAGEREPDLLARSIRELVPGGGSVTKTVQEIIAEVQQRGDEAILELTRRLDTRGADPLPLTVQPSTLAAAAENLDPAVRHALDQAIANVASVAESGLHPDCTVRFAAHEVTLRSAPVHRAAVYVPGGRAAYPSTVVMGVASARAAGVADVAVCSPPGSDGELHEAILAACHLAGATRVYRMGGAQAIAALALGTRTVAPVDVIVGPGNLYVQEAKRLLTGQVGIDGFAGPSDLVVVLDHAADPEPLALDLLAQAEHGHGTLVIAVSPSRGSLERIQARLDQAPDTGAVARLVLTGNLEQALALCEVLAPEHLQLAGPEAIALAPRVTRTGSLFVGEAAGAAFGDYIAGANHILPTAGAARFASALSPQHFRRSFTETRIEDASDLARAAAPLARSEGFELHARSMEARIGENRSP